MATTTQVTVDKAWVKLSDGDCTVQSNSTEQMQFAFSTAQPTTDAALLLSISEPTSFTFSSPVWCKLPSSYTSNQEIVINVVK